jgi:hypothetical protein
MVRTLKLILPIVTLIIFIIIMTTGGIVKKPLNPDEDVVAYILAIRDNVVQEKWDVASENMRKLEDAWDKIRFRIQFSVEGTRIYQFEGGLARLKGAIKSKSQTISTVEVEAILSEWDKLEE